VRVEYGKSAKTFWQSGKATYQEQQEEGRSLVGVVSQPPADIPRRSVEGLECYRMELAWLDGEAWVSVELGHVVLEQSRKHEHVYLKPRHQGDHRIARVDILVPL
jgi:hypothetical protein